MAQAPERGGRGYSSPPPSGPARAGGRAAATRPGRARRYYDARSFPAALGWTLLGTLLPGAGLLTTRWRRFGALLLLATGLTVAVVGLLAYFSFDTLLHLAVSPGMLTAAWIGLATFGVLWVGSIVLTHVLLRPAHPTGWQRLFGAVVVGALSLVVAVPTFVGARTIYDTSSLIEGVFADPGGDAGAGVPSSSSTPFGNPVDPGANKARLPGRVLGGDSGQNRAEELGARTDTGILAAINTRTGDTVLLSLPRQTPRMPFPDGSALDAAWPRGFTNGIPNDAEFFLNAMYHNVPLMTPDAIPSGVADPGAEVLKQSVGAALGRHVAYYVIVNMDGFIEFINALGGITVNINRPVPVGGVTSTNTPPDRWLSPGPDQHLNGVDALWFARGRYGGTDYDRMLRQRCVIRAVAEQANPATVLANYESLTRAGQNIVETDAPNRVLPALLTLANRVRTQPMRSVSFENDVDGFSTVSPDWDLVRERVEDALEPPTAAPATSAPATPSASAGPAAEETPAASPDATPTPEAVLDECAYNPEPLTP